MYRSPSLLPTKIARLWVISWISVSKPLFVQTKMSFVYMKINMLVEYRDTNSKMVYWKGIYRKKRCDNDTKNILSLSFLVYSIHSWFDFHLQESRIPLAVERSAGLFDSESALFKTYVLLLSTLLLVFLAAGSVWELAKRVKRRQKVETESKWNHTSSFKALKHSLSLVFAKPRDWLENLCNFAVANQDKVLFFWPIRCKTHTISLY